MVTSVTLPKVRDLVLPSVTGLRTALDEALDEWNDASAVFHVAMDASAKATILNKLIYHYAAIKLDGVVFGEDQLQRYMRFGDFIVIRVKLFDEGLRSRNYPTRRARRWVRREPLPGFPVDRLHLGYRLDATGSVMKDAFITLPNGNQINPNNWVWQIVGESIEPFHILRDMFGQETFRYEAA